MAKASPFDPDLVRELATLLAETDLTEIEVEKGDLRIRVARTLTASVTVPMAAPAHAPMPIPAPPPFASAAPDSAGKTGALPMTPRNSNTMGDGSSRPRMASNSAARSRSDWGASTAP